MTTTDIYPADRFMYSTDETYNFVEVYLERYPALRDKYVKSVEEAYRDWISSRPTFESVTARVAAQIQREAQAKWVNLDQYRAAVPHHKMGKDLKSLYEAFADIGSIWRVHWIEVARAMHILWRERRDRGYAMSEAECPHSNSFAGSIVSLRFHPGYPPDANLVAGDWGFDTQGHRYSSFETFELIRNSCSLDVEPKAVRDQLRGMRMKLGSLKAISFTAEILRERYDQVYDELLERFETTSEAVRVDLKLHNWHSARRRLILRTGGGRRINWLEAAEQFLSLELPPFKTDAPVPAVEIVGPIQPLGRTVIYPPNFLEVDDSMMIYQALLRNNGSELLTVYVHPVIDDSDHLTDYYFERRELRSGKWVRSPYVTRCHADELRDRWRSELTRFLGVTVSRQWIRAGWEHVLGPGPLPLVPSGAEAGLKLPSGVRITGVTGGSQFPKRIRGQKGKQSATLVFGGRHTGDPDVLAMMCRDFGLPVTVATEVPEPTFLPVSVRPLNTPDLRVPPIDWPSYGTWHTYRLRVIVSEVLEEFEAYMTGDGPITQSRKGDIVLQVPAFVGQHGRKEIRTRYHVCPPSYRAGLQKVQERGVPRGSYYVPGYIEAIRLERDAVLKTDTADPLTAYRGQVLCRTGDGLYWLMDSACFERFYDYAPVGANTK